MQPLNSKDWISKDFSKFGVQKINSSGFWWFYPGRLSTHGASTEVGQQSHKFVFPHRVQEGQQPLAFTFSSNGSC